jgi:hypothetical protein
MTARCGESGGLACFRGGRLGPSSVLTTPQVWSGFESRRNGERGFIAIEDEPRTCFYLPGTVTGRSRKSADAGPLSCPFTHHGTSTLFGSKRLQKTDGRSRWQQGEHWYASSGCAEKRTPRHHALWRAHTEASSPSRLPSVGSGPWRVYTVLLKWSDGNCQNWIARGRGSFQTRRCFAAVLMAAPVSCFR